MTAYMNGENLMHCANPGIEDKSLLCAYSFEDDSCLKVNDTAFIHEGDGNKKM
jgi:hypothetical protein